MSAIFRLFFQLPTLFFSQSEGSAQPGPSSEERRKLGDRKYTKMVQELKTIGLEVVEDNDQLFIMLTDRDSLKKWIEENSGGTVTLMIRRGDLQDKTTETDITLTQLEGYEEKEGKRKRVEAEVILLKQKIQDQAQERNRYEKVLNDVMAQNERLRAREQSKDTEGANRKGQ